MFHEIKARKAKFGFVARVSLSTIYDIGNAIKYIEDRAFNAEMKASGCQVEVKIYTDDEALASDFRGWFVRSAV